MGKKFSGLTHSFVKTVSRPGRYGDGRGGLGLSLLVKPTSNGRWSKTWSQRLRIDSKLVTVGLGSFPSVTLAMARDTCRDRAHRVAKGEDIRKPAPKIPTVAEAFEVVIAARAPSWKGTNTKRVWYISLRYCQPIAAMRVSEVTAAHVLELLAPLWHDKQKTSREVRSNLATVMEWAIAMGHRTANPATPAVARNLGKQDRPVHHRSLEPNALGRAMALVRDADAWWAEKACLLFIDFTCVRSGEATGATWDEVDLDTSTWTIPAIRMKASVKHRVPLSDQALAILAYARNQSGRSQGTIFPPQRGGKYIDSTRISTLLSPHFPYG